MTQRELAKLANVSFSTVSKAFNNSDDISEETRLRVFEIAKQYGCYGDFFKGKYHKKTIAIICPEIASGYYAEFIKRFQELIESDGNVALISSNNFNRDKADELIEYYSSYIKADGIITFELQNRFKKHCNIPMISIFSEPSPYYDTVEVDLQCAIFDAVRLLDSLGHKKIVFLSEKLTHSKAELYKNAMKRIENGNIDVIESKYRFEKAGEDSVKRLLEAQKAFTALLCAYDNIAFGAIKELKRSGLSVPDDVSVIGIDNISESEYAEPPLTTIDSKPEAVCTAAWELLKKKIDNPNICTAKNINIAAELIIRETAAKVK